MKTKPKKIGSIVGLSQSLLDSITTIIFANDKIEEIIIFGSRAKGNYKKGSDIDIAAIAENLSFGELVEIKTKINELPIPYSIDIIDYIKLKNIDLISHINRVGIKIKRKLKRKEQ